MENNKNRTENKNKFIYTDDDMAGIIVYETHPFIPFVPSNASVLILGSFPGKGANKEGDWYYSAARNQFWKILRSVYPTRKIETIEDKKELFEKAGIAITDIILKANRNKGGNLDKDLVIIQDNKEAIQKIIDGQKIMKIYFTSQFVEKMFKSLFPQYTDGEYLPSPSPIYRRMSIDEKIKIYTQKLPKI